MSIQMKHDIEIPAETKRVAESAFPKGHPYFTLREELQIIYSNEIFKDLFSVKGQPAESPWRMIMVSILQYAEGLSDRQAADAVRARIDWKYLLALPLEDKGFDYSVLSEFRGRIIAGQKEEQLLEQLLERFRERGLVRERGKQRTDSTHIQAAIRRLNRLELVGETMRAALNCVAEVAPEWLKLRVPSDWYDRYGPRFSDWRLPKEEMEREKLALQIGQEGHQLLNWMAAADTPATIRQQAEVKIMYRVWIQQYYTQGETVSWRSSDNLPPAEVAIASPYDPDARASQKRETRWVGYKTHLTETCDDDLPHFIVHVETTPSTTQDEQMTEHIHQDLATSHLSPGEHLVDRGYVTTAILKKSQQTPTLELIGPIRIDSSWQASQAKGFDLSHFTINWEKQTVTCPQGHNNQSWRLSKDKAGLPKIAVRFATRTCQGCPVRTDCTHGDSRCVYFKPKEDFEILQWARQRELSHSFQKRYAKRAGIEGTISQATRTFDLRRSRFYGLEKTHLQHILIAIAINLSRFVNWVQGHRPKSTYTSPFAALAFAHL